MHPIELAAVDVHRFVAQRVANRADAADIAQETLLDAWTTLHAVPGEPVDEWLFAMARKRIAQYDRARQRIPLAIDAVAAHETETALQIGAAAVVATCDCHHRVNGWLRRCAQLLRPGQQVAVMLADVYEYGDKDSAAMLRMSVPSFKLLLHRSRARLHTFGSTAASSRVGVRMRNDGVIPHLNGAELRRLREHLLTGIRLVTMWVWSMSDLIDVELLDLLFDLQ